MNQNRNFPEWKPGDPVSLEELARLDRQSRQVQNLTVEGAETVAAEGFLAASRPPPGSFWAEVGVYQGAGVYLVTEVGDDGGDPPAYSHAEGMLLDVLAAEVTGSSAVPAGAVVRCWPGTSEVSPWGFAAPPVADGGTLTDITVNLTEDTTWTLSDLVVWTLTGGPLSVWNILIATVNFTGIVNFTGVVNFLVAYFGGPTTWGYYTPAQWTSNQNDYDPTGGGARDWPTILRASTNGLLDLTGVVPDVRAAGGGYLLFEVQVVGSDPLNISHAHAGSTAAHRFDLPGGYDLTLKGGDWARFYYDAVALRWKLSATTAVAVTSGAVGAAAVGSSGMIPQIVTDAAGRITSLTEVPAVSGQGSGWNDALTGTSPQRWYAGALRGVYSPATAGITSGLLYAVVLRGYGGRTIDKVKLNVQGAAAAGKHARVGIYSSVDPGTPYPDTLLADSGAFLVDSTGDKAATLGSPVALSSSTQTVWLVVLAEAAVSLLGLATGAQIDAINGLQDDWTTLSGGAGAIGWSTAQAYGALPGTFPSTPNAASSLAANLTPLLGVHFSA